jgi:hypothetical protein
MQKKQTITTKKVNKVDFIYISCMEDHGGGGSKGVIDAGI